MTDASQSKLDFALISNPSPVLAGLQSSLTLLITNPGPQMVLLQELIFAFPIGKAATQLLSSGDGIEGSMSNGWTLTKLTDNTLVGLPPEGFTALRACQQDQNEKLIPAELTQDSLQVELTKLQFNNTPGTGRFHIRESSAIAAEDPAVIEPVYANAWTLIKIVKHPIGDGRIQPNPITEFRPNQVNIDAGTELRLTWMGPVHAAYEVTYGEGVTPKTDDTYLNGRVRNPTGTTADFEWKGTVTRDTVFQLSAKIDADYHRYATTAVNVKKPRLKVEELSVGKSGNEPCLSVFGNIKVNGIIEADNSKLLNPSWKELWSISGNDIHWSPGRGFEIKKNFVTSTDGFVIGSCSLDSGADAYEYIAIGITGSHFDAKTSVRGDPGEVGDIMNSCIAPLGAGCEFCLSVTIWGEVSKHLPCPIAFFWISGIGGELPQEKNREIQ